jgi:hypothetical protein
VVAVSLAASGDLADTDVPLASSTNQLVTFDVFQTKNPFTPQVTDSPVPSADAPSAANKAGADVPTSGTSLPTLPSSITLPTLPGLPGSGATATPGGGASTPGQGVVPPGTTTTTPTTTTTTTTTPTTTTAAPSPAVSISVNGTVSRVSTNGTFPSGAPVFRLAGYTKGSARIGIVGGSYQAGGETLTLHQGVPVTLQNTSDGKKYTIQLLSTP